MDDRVWNQLVNYSHHMAYTVGGLMLVGAMKASRKSRASVYAGVASSLAYFLGGYLIQSGDYLLGNQIAFGTAITLQTLSIIRLFQAQRKIVPLALLTISTTSCLFHSAALYKINLLGWDEGFEK